MRNKLSEVFRERFASEMDVNESAASQYGGLEDAKAKGRKKCLIYQHSPFRFAWDIFITSQLICICTVMPYHIAFNHKTLEWCITYYVMDFFFAIDIAIIFFTTLPETDEKDEVTDKKSIAIAYIKSWFFIDLMAIFPFDLLFSSFRDTGI